jgi:hypothetical protein
VWPEGHRSANRAEARSSQSASRRSSRCRRVERPHGAPAGGARQRKHDVEERIIENRKDHPQSTTGDIAKG